jgi:hypothetical protein
MGHMLHPSLGCPANVSNIAPAIIQGNAVAVCNGSYKDQFGTLGFVLQQGESHISCITTHVVTPGHLDKINPYHREFGGILAIVVVAEAITTFHDINKGTIKLGCDCASSISTIFKQIYDTPNNPTPNLFMRSNRSLLQAI